MRDIYNALAVDSGQPLDRQSRYRLERAFGADFSDIRIHTGEWADHAARKLGARAFTVGRRIVFAAGQYAPHTADGLSLLAHELAHGIQQRDLPGPPEFVGAADDEMEQEANLASQSILAGKPLPLIGRDTAKALRRAIVVDRNSAASGSNFSLAVPALSPGQGAFADSVIFHLTKGVDLTNPRKSAAAFRFDGQVGVSLGSGDSLKGWEFAFLQFVRFNNLGIFYAGKKNRHGSIGIQVDKAMTTTIALDPLKMAPWTSEQPFTFSGGLAKNAMGDHPFLACRQTLQNDETKEPNFLFHVVDDRDFWSLFSFRDDKGNFVHLRHQHWKLRYEAKFRWKNSTMQEQQMSTLVVDAFTPGPPNEPQLSQLLASPGGPAANDVMDAGIKAALLAKGGPSISHNKTRFNSVPPDFFG